MKNILILLVVVALTSSACSKDPLQNDSTFFYFQVKYGTEEVVEYGHNNFYDYYGGPMYRPVRMPDSTMLFFWPDYDKPGPDISPFPIWFIKKGNNIVGDYTLAEKMPYSFTIYTASSGKSRKIHFHPIPGSEKLRITKTGDSETGQYAEGTMDFDTYLSTDTVNVVRASATFRVKMQ